MPYRPEELESFRSMVESLRSPEMRLAAYLGTLEATGAQNAADVVQTVLNRTAINHNNYGASIADQLFQPGQYTPFSAALGHRTGDKAANAAYNKLGMTREGLLSLAARDDWAESLNQVFGKGDPKEARTVLSDFAGGGKLSRNARDFVGDSVYFRGNAGPDRISRGPVGPKTGANAFDRPLNRYPAATIQNGRVVMPPQGVLQSRGYALPPVRPGNPQIADLPARGAQEMAGRGFTIPGSDSRTLRGFSGDTPENILPSNRTLVTEPGFAGRSVPVTPAFDTNRQYSNWANRNAAPFDGVVIHHTGVNMPIEQLTQSMANNRRGYHFVVTPDAQIYQTAPLDQRTNHILGPSSGTRSEILSNLANANSIGISFNVPNSDLVTPEMYAAAKALIGDLHDQGVIPDLTKIGGHDEMQPGTAKGRGSKDGSEGNVVAQNLRGMAEQPLGGSFGERRARDLTPADLPVAATDIAFATAPPAVLAFDPAQPASPQIASQEMFNEIMDAVFPASVPATAADGPRLRGSSSAPAPAPARSAASLYAQNPAIYDPVGEVPFNTPAPPSFASPASFDSYMDESVYGPAWSRPSTAPAAAASAPATSRDYAPDHATMTPQQAEDAIAAFGFGGTMGRDELGPVMATARGVMSADRAGAEARGREAARAAFAPAAPPPAASAPVAQRSPSFASPAALGATRDEFYGAAPARTPARSAAPPSAADRDTANFTINAVTRGPPTPRTDAALELERWAPAPRLPEPIVVPRAPPVAAFPELTYPEYGKPFHDRSRFEQYADRFDPNRIDQSGWLSPFDAGSMAYNHARGAGDIDLAGRISSRYPDDASLRDAFGSKSGALGGLGGFDLRDGMIGALMGGITGGPLGAVIGGAKRGFGFDPLGDALGTSRNARSGEGLFGGGLLGSLLGGGSDSGSSSGSSGSSLSDALSSMFSGSGTSDNSWMDPFGDNTSSWVSPG